MVIFCRRIGLFLEGDCGEFSLLKVIFLIIYRKGLFLVKELGLNFYKKIYGKWVGYKSRWFMMF